jgi:predicted membrane protein
MSLRAFHIVFIVVSVVLSLFIAMWGFSRYAADSSGTSLALAIIFLAGAAVLIVYGKKVYGKLKEIP